MPRHIIHFAEACLAAAVDDLRDTLAEVAGSQLVSRADPKERDHWCRTPRHLYWQGRQLNTLQLQMLLHQLGIVFCDAQGRPLNKPPSKVLRTFLSLAATFNWFDPVFGAENRACDPFVR